MGGPGHIQRHAAQESNLPFPDGQFPHAQSTLGTLGTVKADPEAWEGIWGTVYPCDSPTPVQAAETQMPSMVGGPPRPRL